MSSLPVIFFDLDDTLIYEDATDVAVIVEVVQRYLPQRAIPTLEIVGAVREAAHTLWYQSEAADYCRRIQTSPIEGLYGDYAGEGSGLRAVRDYISSGYRERVWSRALHSLYGNEAARLAPAVAREFTHRRANRHVHFADATATLHALADSFRLGLITNGAPRVQRAKLVGSGLSPYFDPVVVSGEFGEGKPHPSIYLHALSLVGVPPDLAVMIGNSLPRDIVGAQACGIRGIWFNPNGESAMREKPWRIAEHLREIPAVLRHAFPAGSPSPGSRPAAK